MASISLFPKFMDPISGTGGVTNVVEAFELELASAPDVEVADPVDVEVGQDAVDVEVEEPVDVEVPT